MPGELSEEDLGMVELAPRTLGERGPLVSAVGLGCMGMSFSYGPADEDEAIAVVHEAMDSGVTFFDTADMYGNGANERLLGRALGSRRKDVLLATKFGILTDPRTSRSIGVDGSPDYVRKAVDRSLSRLGTDYIDLYYQHRPDPGVPIEDTVGAMTELVDAGKVRYLGLSEPSETTVRRAAAVAPITAVQTEWSVFSRDIEDAVLPACRDFGIGVVAYSPLGRGLLSGAPPQTAALAPDDFRRTLPRWQDGNLQRNLALAGSLADIAKAKGATSAQVAVAWLLAREEHVVPIPGTTKRAHLRDNLGALAVSLTAQELAQLDQLRPVGTRYPDMTWVNRDTKALPERGE